ncbi:hypothetical protein O6H91_18G072300 [Diphasiastrum complanatum]|uniref:Uncharacterized protein n=1 Tax=Diphasiastrum complanatum TaxID=34168 RepID=A0ACC2B2P0_DIPCM|nr:hypothetical protein O6H91_18G072300 [Diphasiastrum complanatum]
MEIGSPDIGLDVFQAKKLEARVAALTEKLKILESENKFLKENLSDLLKIFSRKQGTSYRSPNLKSLAEGSFTEKGLVCRSCGAVQMPENNDTLNSVCDAEMGKDSFSFERFLSKQSSTASIDISETGTVFSSDRSRLRNVDQQISELVIKEQEGLINTGADEHSPVNSATGSDFTHAAGTQQEKRNKKKGNSSREMPGYAKRHVALKIMYLGERYHGFASQACSSKTVEAELFTALEKTKLLLGERSEANYSRCGRTDKGVSATGQVIALYLRSGQKTKTRVAYSGSCDQSIESGETRSKQQCAFILDKSLSVETAGEGSTASLINDVSKDMVYEKREIFAEGKELRGYTVAAPKASEWNEAALTGSVAFQGSTNTSSSTLSLMWMFMRSNIWVMQVKGSAFLWHQVRCMAAVLLMVGYGYESPSVVQELLDLSITPRKPQYAMASEFPLVLHACAFDNLTFQCSPEATNQVRLHLENLMGQEFIKTAIFQDGLPSVVLSRPKTMLKRTHIPLQLHETEPTYEERRLSKSKAT